MAKKTYSAEQIIGKLREAEVLTNRGIGQNLKTIPYVTVWIITQAFAA